jgi:hypothetical protein
MECGYRVRMDAIAAWDRWVTPLPAARSMIDYLNACLACGCKLSEIVSATPGGWVTHRCAKCKRERKVMSLGHGL